jgi:integrase
MRFCIPQPLDRAGIELGAIPIRHWHAAWINARLTTMKAEEYAHATVKQAASFLAGYLKWAASYGWVMPGLIYACRVPYSQGLKAPVALDEAQLERVLVTARNYTRRGWPVGKAETLLRLMCDCGLRPAEAWWLSRAEVHGSPARIELCDTPWRLVKNARAARTVPLPSHVARLLNCVSHDGPMYFTDPGAKPWGEPGEDPWYHAIGEIRRLSGVDMLTARILRHTFATRYMAAAQGATWGLRSLQTILGHGSSVTTESYYIQPEAPRMIEMRVVAG